MHKERVILTKKFKGTTLDEKHSRIESFHEVKIDNSRDYLRNNFSYSQDYTNTKNSEKTSPILAIRSLMKDREM